jgi:anti-anti-sigma factor
MGREQVELADNRADVNPLVLSRGRDSEGTVRLAAVGEVDICDAPRLRAAIETTLVDPTTAALVVDLARLTYIDSTGVGVLLAGLRLAQQHGVRFTVVNVRAEVLRVLTILGLDQVLAPTA